MCVRALRDSKYDQVLVARFFTLNEIDGDATCPKRFVVNWGRSGCCTAVLVWQLSLARAADTPIIKYYCFVYNRQLEFAQLKSIPA